MSKKHIIVVGNEKGGAGKTTTSIHIIANLLSCDFKVASIDLDYRQRSLTRYIENRKNYLERSKQESLSLSLPVPLHNYIEKSRLDSAQEAKLDEQERLRNYIDDISSEYDFIVIDTPGSDTELSRYAHSLADTVVTPINDSFVDLDVLASFEPQTIEVKSLGIYSEMLWERKLIRAKNKNKPLDWIVIRNRLSSANVDNKKNMQLALLKLSKRLGFRHAKGFSERVIFRELFLKGLTLLDLLEQQDQNNITINLSYIAARRELRLILEALNIDVVNKKLRVGTDGEVIGNTRSIVLQD